MLVAITIGRTLNRLGIESMCFILFTLLTENLTTMASGVSPQQRLIAAR
jgi:hypothetical protein